jgi:hypothetical protein
MIQIVTIKMFDKGIKTNSNLGLSYTLEMIFKG